MAVSGCRRVLRGQLRCEGVDQPDVQVRRSAGEQRRKSHHPRAIIPDFVDFCPPSNPNHAHHRDARRPPNWLPPPASIGR